MICYAAKKCIFTSLACALFRREGQTMDNVCKIQCLFGIVKMQNGKQELYHVTITLQQNAETREASLSAPINCNASEAEFPIIA